MAAEFASVMAGAASAHQAATASRQGNGKQRAGRTRRTSADPQRAQQGATAAAAAAPAALDSLSRLQQLADASPQVAQLRRLQALANDRFAPVAQFAGGPEEEELVQGKFAAAQLQPQLQQAPLANNTGLPDQLKSGIESLSGLSLDHVRVHYNSSQPAQLNALAYAQGSDIHLAPGQERHLPHEAWHVVQQAQGRVRPTLRMKDGVQVNDDVGLEREADVMGLKATQINCTRHLCPDSALPSKLAIRNNSSILLQRKIYKDKKFTQEIANIDSYIMHATPQERPILKNLFDAKEEKHYIKDALAIARKQSVQNLTAMPGVVAPNSAAAPLASAVPPPSIPDEKPHKPIVITIPTSSAHGDNKNQKQPEAARLKLSTREEEVHAIINDMKRQFKMWNGTIKDRGAWWGAKNVGKPEGAKNVPQNLIKDLKRQLNNKDGWIFKDSRTGGTSFHKTWGNVDFIYHMLTPPS